MRHCYEWQNRERIITCPICGRTLTVHSQRQKYCKSPECRRVLYERQRARIYLKRERERERRMRNEELELKG